MPQFIPGLKLGELFFHEVVQSVLAAHFPGLDYAAALIGSGSEILGFDTEMSTDHHWGPRAMLFLNETDFTRHVESITDIMRHELPHTFHGYSTNFAPPNPDDHGTQLPQPITSGPVNHRVELYTVRGFCVNYLGLDPRDGLSALDWLTIPAQKLRTITAGAVYHDGPGDLTHVRHLLAYYPQDVWLYLLAAGWTRIAQEEHLMGRAGFAGDELGSRLIGARLVHDLMHLCFLMARQYAPYSKWFGTAFARLEVAPRLEARFHTALSAHTWQERQEALCAAYEIAAGQHNALNITPPLPVQVSPFFGRPFMVIQAEKFAEAITAQIQDPDIRRMAQESPIGAVDQFSTSTDLLSHTPITRRARALYG